MKRVKETLGQDAEAISRADALGTLCPAHGADLRAVHGATDFSAGDLTVRELEPPFDWPVTVLPLPAVSTVLQPPFAEGGTAPPSAR